MTEAIWRRIDSGPCDAAVNMAIDEAILRHAGVSPPTVRFYGWQPPAVSIGRHQDLSSEVDRERCQDLGIDWVRRPTGGRAVLHDRELTYSLVIAQSLLPGSIIETYRRISEGLVAGIRSLGLAAELHTPSAPQHSLAGACFDSASWYELTVAGKKVVGSAQVRSGQGILQHGSVLLELDAERLLQALGMVRGTDVSRLARAFERRAAGLSQLSGNPIGPWQAADAIASGLEAAFGVTIEVGNLTASEQELAELLATRKYGSRDWNELRVDPTADMGGDLSG